MAEIPENIIIRPAVRSDCDEIYRLIKELAVYEKMPNAVQITKETLEKDGFETEPARWKAFVAEVKEPGIQKLAGFALYNLAYSTWDGKKLLLDRAFVSEEYRESALEQSLYQTFVQAGVDIGAAKMDWFCLSWNPARKFYEKLGAINLTEVEDWNVYRLEKDEMLKLSS